MNINNKNQLICDECGEIMKGEIMSDLGLPDIKGNEPLVWRTLVGYHSPEGHNHDDNCSIRSYICPNNHTRKVSIRNICLTPGCDWKGKEECFCHKGKKLEIWPI